MSARQALRACVFCVVLLGPLPFLAGQPSSPTKDLYYFVIDRSLSIDTNGLVKPFRDAVTGYVEKLGKEAQVEIIFFNNVATAPASWFPMDRQAKDDFCKHFDRNFRPRGDTLLYATVADVLYRVWTRESEFRRIRILILSDGEDNRSAPKYKRWEDVERVVPAEWKVRKGLSVVWAAVEFDPKQKPGPGSLIQVVKNLERDQIEKKLIPAPVAAFTASPRVVKVSEDVLFALDDDPDVTAATWSFGDGGTSNKKADTHRYGAKGTYDIAVSVEGPGGQATEERKAYIEVIEEPRLEAHFSWYPPLPRVNQEFKFVDESLGCPTSWLWDCPGISLQKNDRGPTATFSKPGKTVVTLTVARQGKKDSIQREVEVFDQPADAGLTAEPNVLEKGQVVHLKASRHQNGWIHRWSVGRTIRLPGQGPEAEWKADRIGRVDIVHYVSGPGGGSERVFTVYVKEEAQPPRALFRWYPARVYVGEQVQLVDESRGEPNEWTWEIPGIGTKNGHDLAPVTFSQPGKVIVKLTVAGHGRADSVQRQIDVLPVVVADFAAEPGDLQTGEMLRLKAGRNEPGWTHRWIVDDKDIGTGGPDANWPAGKIGAVVVVHSVSDPGGPAKEKSKVVTVRDRLAAKFHWSSAHVRVGEPVEFIDESRGQPDEWTWEIPGIGTKKGRDLAPVTFSQPGKVVVRLTVARDGKQDSLQREVDVSLVLSAAFDANPKEGPPPLTVQFKDKSEGANIVSWRWDFGDGQTSDEKDPVHKYQAQGQAQSLRPRLTIRNSAGQEATCPGNVVIRLQPSAAPKPSVPSKPLTVPKPAIPPWLKLLALAVGILLLYVVVIVPLILRPLRLPHRDAAVKAATTMHDLRPLAIKHRWNWLWPRRYVTLGTLAEDDIRLTTTRALAADRTLATIVRSVGTKTYWLVALQADMVSQVSSPLNQEGEPEKTLIPLSVNQRVELRDGDKFEISGKSIVWRQPIAQTTSRPA